MASFTRQKFHPFHLASHLIFRTRCKNYQVRNYYKNEGGIPLSLSTQNHLVIKASSLIDIISNPKVSNWNWSHSIEPFLNPDILQVIFWFCIICRIKSIHVYTSMLKNQVINISMDSLYSLNNFGVVIQPPPIYLI